MVFSGSTKVISPLTAVLSILSPRSNDRISGVHHFCRLSVLAVLFAMFLTLIVNSMANAQETKTVNLVTASVFDSGKSNGATVSVVENAFRITAKQAGYTINEVKIGTANHPALIEEVRALIADGKIDALVLSADDILDLEAAGVPLDPFITIDFKGSQAYRECLFVAKNDSRKTIGQFRGSVLSGWGFDSLQRLLAEQGVEEHYTNFFGKVVDIQGYHPAWIDAVDEGRIDGFMAGVLGMSFAMATKPAVSSKIRPLECTSSKPFPAVALSKDIDSNIRNNLTDSFNSSATRDSIKKELSFFVSRLHWDFALASSEWFGIFETARAFRNEAIARGWTSAPGTAE